MDCKDPIVNRVISNFINRSNVGIKKYGTTLDRDDLNTLDWIKHTQEELMDAILYLETLKDNIQKKYSKNRNQNWCYKKYCCCLCQRKLCYGYEEESIRPNNS